MERMSGIKWGRAKSRLDLFDKTRGTYYHEGNQLIPLIESMDPKLISMIGDNQGDVCMCHHDDRNTYCGGCGIVKGRIIKTVKVEKERYAKKRKRLNPNSNQIK